METLDSRDLQKELDELTPEVETWTEIVNANQEEERMDEYPGLEVIGRQGELERLADECSGCGWEHGITFIPKDDFEAYAEELAGDIGAIDPEAGWPLNRIDWEAAADDLKIDYTESDFNGTSYYWREA